MGIRTGGLVAISVLVAAFSAATVPRAQAAAQPDPALKAHIESTYVNLSVAPTFRLLVETPTMFQFTAISARGQLFLEILAVSAIDSLDIRIRRASDYLEKRQSIFTPLFDNPPNRPIMGYVDRSRFERALRDLLPARRLSYNRRLT